MSEELNKEKNLLNEVFDEEAIKNLEHFKHQTEYNDVSKLLKNVEAKKNEPLKKNQGNIIEIADHLDTILENYTIDQLKKLTPEEVEKIYIMDDTGDTEGISIQVDSPSDSSDYDIKKDYLIFRKETSESTKSINESMTDLSKYIQDYNDDIKSLTKDFGSMENYIINILTKKIEANEDSSEKMELYKKIKNEFDNAFTLNDLKTYVVSYKGNNILGDFINPDRSNKIYRKYLKINKSIGITTDFTKYSGFETYLYNAEQIKYIRKNIFIFSLIHYIANKRYDEIDKNFGIFVSQINTNIKNVIYNNSDSEMMLDFMDNVRDIVSIVG